MIKTKIKSLFERKEKEIYENLPQLYVGNININQDILQISKFANVKESNRKLKRKEKFKIIKNINPIIGFYGFIFYGFMAWQIVELIYDFIKHKH